MTSEAREFYVEIEIIQEKKLSLFNAMHRSVSRPQAEDQSQVDVVLIQALAKNIF